MLDYHALLQIAQGQQSSLNCPVREFSIGGQFFPFNQRPAIMGVINLSPDSWYRESVCLSTHQALDRAHVLRAQGAHIIDIGAESTLAHAARVDAALQQSRLIPVIRELRTNNILVSAETYDSSVAQAALEAGANVLNLTGRTEAEEIFRIAAERNAAVILCYVQGVHVRAVEEYRLEDDPVGYMLDFFRRQIEIATRCGVERIFLDPGLGFYYRNLQDSALRVRFQMQVFLNSFRLRALGWPICNALPHAFEFFGEEVRSAEPFFAVLAALGKTDLFRTHEVSKIKAVLGTMSVF